MGLQKRLINVLLQNILDKFKSEIKRQNISGELYKNSSNFNNSKSQFGALFQRINFAPGIIPNLTKISLSICGQSPLRKKAVNKYIKAPYVTLQTHSR